MSPKRTTLTARKTDEPLLVDIFGYVEDLPGFAEEPSSPAPVALHSLGARVVMASSPHPESGFLTLGVRYTTGLNGRKYVSLYHVTSIAGKIGHNTSLTVEATSRVIVRIDNIINALLPYLYKVRSSDVGYQDYYFRFPEEG